MIVNKGAIHVALGLFMILYGTQTQIAKEMQLSTHVSFPDNAICRNHNMVPSEVFAVYFVAYNYVVCCVVVTCRRVTPSLHTFHKLLSSTFAANSNPLNQFELQA